MDADAIKSHGESRREEMARSRGAHLKVSTERRFPAIHISMDHLVTVCSLLVLLMPGWGLAQSTLRSQQEVNALEQPPQGTAPILALPAERHHFLKSQQDVSKTAETTYESLNKDHNRVGLFVAAAAGTVSLMALMYCIYNRFYSKQQYMHAQLHDDAEMTLDLPGNLPHLTFPQGPAGDGRERPGGYGSLSATPSVISIPPSLSPPPHVSPFPPPYRSSQALRTISARDLERSFL